MKRIRLFSPRAALALVLILALGLALAGCSGRESSSSSPPSSSQPEDPEYPVSIGDVKISQRPDRVVSLSPGLTEWIIALGYGEQLVGVSDYCDRPEGSLEGLIRCGSPQSLNLEALDNAQAELVVTSVPLVESELVQLQQRSVQVLVLERVPGMDKLREQTVNLARALEGELSGKATGEAYFDGLTARMDALEARGSMYNAAADKKVSVIMLRMPDFIMATGDTFEHTLLEAMGFENAAAPYGDWVYPKEEAANLAPDLIISDQSVTIPDFEKNPVYKGGQATILDQVVNVDFTAFERQSPRMLEELEKVADFIYPAPEGAGDSAQEETGEAPSQNGEPAQEAADD